MDDSHDDCFISSLLTLHNRYYTSGNEPEALLKAQHVDGHKERKMMVMELLSGGSLNDKLEMSGGE